MRSSWEGGMTGEAVVAEALHQVDQEAEQGSKSGLCSSSNEPFPPAKLHFLSVPLCPRMVPLAGEEVITT